MFAAFFRVAAFQLSLVVVVVDDPEPARSQSTWTFKRIDLSTGKATLKVRAMNQVALTGDVATFSMPPMEPGRAHDLVVRATCATASEVVFDGAGP